VNRPSEAFYILDRDSRAVVTPFSALARRPDALFEARHGLGYSSFSTDQEDLEVTLTQTVDQRRPVKLSSLRVRNQGSTPRELRVFAYAEWLLGNNPARSRPYIVTSHDEETGAVLATNRFNTSYRRHAFLGANTEVSSFTGSRRDFIGRFGSIVYPSALSSDDNLSGSVGVDGDPCGAIACDIRLAPGEGKEIVFALGDAETSEEAVALLRELQAEDFAKILDETTGHWRGFTGRLSVKTPDRAFDTMVNHWLPYQAFGCRITARSAFYQASGAYGFRDQLQDTLAFLAQQPSLARQQILSAGSRQFPEGDVQHWWLPQGGAGVRTRIADDVVWLAYAANEYIRATGDVGILDEELPFIEGPMLEENQHDLFFEPTVTPQTASLYEHAARALDLAVSRTGEHGLPLMLGGDWNDGMNRVGIGGKGQSVWLGWFLLGTLAEFETHARKRGEFSRAEHWSQHAARLKEALESAGWDGAHYRRGYFDDGSPLGSSQSDECRIDSISQSWSVLSGAGDPARSAQAMDAVLSELVDDENGIIRLFTPPFSQAAVDPGYIKAYPPGVRENGGQYTHAATWVVLALIRLGRTEDAWRCFNLLNPIHHARDPEAAELYRVEPYVVAADVYGAGDLAGRGGWTWYTGSAGWLYRVAVEGILGIRREAGRLLVQPAIPAEWPGYSAQVVIDGVRCDVVVERREGALSISVNGKVVDGQEGILLSEISGAKVRRPVTA